MVRTVHETCVLSPSSHDASALLQGHSPATHGRSAGSICPSTRTCHKGTHGPEGIPIRLVKDNWGSLGEERPPAPGLWSGPGLCLSLHGVRSQVGSSRDPLPPPHCPPLGQPSWAVTPRPLGAVPRKPSVPSQAQLSLVHAPHDNS